MAGNQLTIDSNFVVGEAIWLDLLIAAIFYFMVICTLASDDYSSRYFIRSLLICVGPAIGFTIKALLNTKALTVNKTGIYIKTTLVTDWRHFENAYVEQAPIDNGQISDTNYLILEYSKDGEDGFFERRLLLTDTQNKSEEEIIAAINFFGALPKNN
jgi:hypothetical protein